MWPWDGAKRLHWKFIWMVRGRRNAIQCAHWQMSFNRFFFSCCFCYCAYHSIRYLFEREGEKSRSRSLLHHFSCCFVNLQKKRNHVRTANLWFDIGILCEIDWMIGCTVLWAREMSGEFGFRFSLPLLLTCTTHTHYNDYSKSKSNKHFVHDCHCHLNWLTTFFHSFALFPPLTVFTYCDACFGFVSNEIDLNDTLQFNINCDIIWNAHLI